MYLWSKNIFEYIIYIRFNKYKFKFFTEKAFELIFIETFVLDLSFQTQY